MTPENTPGGRKAEPMETEQELTPQEYEHLLAQYENSFKNLQEGQIIRGRVLAVTPSEVIVDIGYKSEGIIPATEFTDFSGNVMVKPGDAVDVLLERTEDQNGYVVLSKDKAEKMKVWDEVEKSYRSGSTVRGRVIDRIKGRPRRRHRRQGVPAGLARRRQAGQEPRGPPRQRPRLQGHLGRQEARQHRPLAQGRRRGRAGSQEEGNPAAARRGPRPARHRQEPDRLRRLRGPGRGSTASSTSPTCRGAA